MRGGFCALSIRGQGLEGMRSFARVAAFVFVMVGAPSLAEAHAAMVRADPGVRAVVQQAPETIRLWFSEPVEQEFANVVVESDGGVQVQGVGKPYVDPADRTLLIVPIPRLPNGEYRVRYKVLSVDGHVVDWGYSFRVRSHGKGND